MDLSAPECLFPSSQLQQLPSRPGTLPAVRSARPVEDYVPRSPPTNCDFSPKPGVVAFRKFVLENLGGGDSGICRSCEGGVPTSEHNEGRAWDWRVLLNNPTDVERVEKLFDWLLKNDNENFRRLGLRYMIWDKRIYSAGSRAWKPYGGPGQSPHQDHVHFTFGHAGANAETSFFDGLRAPSTGPGIGGALTALALGGVAGWFAAGYLPKP